MFRIELVITIPTLDSFLSIQKNQGDQIIKLLQNIQAQQVTEEREIMKELDDLKAEVAETKSVEQSAIVLINGIGDRVKAAGTDPAALQALTSDLKSEADALAAAVAANTPAATAPATTDSASSGTTPAPGA